MHAEFWASLGQPADIHCQISVMSDEEYVTDEDGGGEDLFGHELPVLYAADAAARAVNGPLAPIPVLHLRKPDVKHQARFPYVLGAFDTDVVTVEWNLCNGQNISDIFTCKMFGCGRGAQKTMGVWARELMKYFKSICSDDEALLIRIDNVLKCPRSAIQADDFEVLLQTILAQAIKLVPTRVFLQKYSRLHVLHCVCKSFFPSITEIQVAQCRCPFCFL